MKKVKIPYAMSYKDRFTLLDTMRRKKLKHGEYAVDKSSKYNKEEKKK